jgi:hypothetical protein
VGGKVVVKSRIVNQKERSKNHKARIKNDPEAKLRGLVNFGQVLSMFEYDRQPVEFIG